MEEIGYPIKYAILELREPGGWSNHYEDIINGYIASKCFVIESNREYKKNGLWEVRYKVVFPYNDIEVFKRCKHNNLGDLILPRYNARDEIYPITIVDDLFDEFELTRKIVNEKNANLNHEIFHCVSFSDSDWKKELKKREDRLLSYLKESSAYEQAIEEELKDVKISTLELRLNKKPLV